MVLVRTTLGGTLRARGGASRYVCMYVHMHVRSKYVTAAVILYYTVHYTTQHNKFLL